MSHERNTRIDEEFVPAASPALPATADEWRRARDGWMNALHREVFAGWPREPAPLALREVGRAEHDGVILRAWDFTPQEPFTLRLWVAQRADLTPEQLYTDDRAASGSSPPRHRRAPRLGQRVRAARPGPRPLIAPRAASQSSVSLGDYGMTTIW